MNYEKKDITVVLKVNSNENEILKSLKNEITNTANKYNITLSMSQIIDENINSNDVIVEYYSRANADEVIGKNYLNFLDKFLDIGYETGINTIPME
jgi:hypothetical protein